jgi:hypothetical protein
MHWLLLPLVICAVVEQDVSEETRPSTQIIAQMGLVITVSTLPYLITAFYSGLADETRGIKFPAYGIGSLPRLLRAMRQRRSLPGKTITKRGIAWPSGIVSSKLYP